MRNLLGPIICVAIAASGLWFIFQVELDKPARPATIEVHMRPTPTPKPAPPRFYVGLDKDTYMVGERSQVCYGLEPNEAYTLSLYQAEMYKGPQELFTEDITTDGCFPLLIREVDIPKVSLTVRVFIKGQEIRRSLTAYVLPKQ